MVERRDSKGPKDLREEASPAARKDPRRDSFQMSMPAVVADLTRELGKLKKRVAELEKDVEREKAGRLKAEEALARRPVEKQRSERPEKSEKSDELASRMTRELRAPRKGTVPFHSASSVPPRGVSPAASTQPPPPRHDSRDGRDARSEHATKRIATVTRVPSQSSPPERKR